MSYIKGYKEDFDKWLKKCRIHTFKLANRAFRYEMKEKGFYFPERHHNHHSYSNLILS